MEFEWDKAKAETNYMKKNKKNDELRPEYTKQDFGKGVRGKYHKDYLSGTNLILLQPDVASVFPDEKSVNEALRSLIKIAKNSTDIPMH